MPSSRWARRASPAESTRTGIVCPSARSCLQKSSTLIPIISCSRRIASGAVDAIASRASRPSLNVNGSIPISRRTIRSSCNQRLSSSRTITLRGVVNTTPTVAGGMGRLTYPRGKQHLANARQTAQLWCRELRGCEILGLGTPRDRGPRAPRVRRPASRGCLSWLPCQWRVAAVSVRGWRWA